VDTALRQGRQLLEEHGIAAPRLTAEVLLSHAMGRERSYLYGHPEEELSEAAWLHYGRYLHERLNGKPTQYITRRQEFYGRPFQVTEDVLIPRPETEHAVETALRLAAGMRRAVDVGCGSGAIAVTLKLETGAEVWGTDISPGALRVARENARRLGADIHLVRCDLASALAAGSFDVLVSNPPYVPLGEGGGLPREIREHEPRVALFAGETGLEVYERLIEEARRVLRPGGWLVMELGVRSLEPVRGMLRPDWTEAGVTEDLAGLPRVMAARHKP